MVVSQTGADNLATFDADYTDSTPTVPGVREVTAGGNETNGGIKGKITHIVAGGKSIAGRISRTAQDELIVSTGFRISDSGLQLWGEPLV